MKIHFFIAFSRLLGYNGYIIYMEANMKEVKVDSNKSLVLELQSLNISITSFALAEITSLWKSDIVAWPFTRIYCIKSGHAYLHTHSGDIEMTAGNIYIIPSEFPCGYSGDGDMYKLWIQLTVNRLDNQDIFSKIHNVLTLQNKAETIDFLIDTYKKYEFSSPFVLTAQLYGIISEGIKISGLTKDDFPEYSFIIKKAIALIYSRNRIDYKAEACAKDLGIKPNDLQRMFKHETGMALGQFIKETIMRKASVELKSNLKSIKDISDDLGFANQFYFARVFKEYFGVTPSDYRKHFLI